MQRRSVEVFFFFFDRRIDRRLFDGQRLRMFHSMAWGGCVTSNTFCIANDVRAVSVAFKRRRLRRRFFFCFFNPLDVLVFYFDFSSFFFPSVLSPPGTEIKRRSNDKSMRAQSFFFLFLNIVFFFFSFFFWKRCSSMSWTINSRRAPHSSDGYLYILRFHSETRDSRRDLPSGYRVFFFINKSINQSTIGALMCWFLFLFLCCR